MLIGPEQTGDVLFSSGILQISEVVDSDSMANEAICERNNKEDGKGGDESEVTSKTDTCPESESSDSDSSQERSLPRQTFSILEAYALYDSEIGYCQGEIKSSFDFVELSYTCVDNFDTQSILDEEIEQGIDSIMEDSNHFLANAGLNEIIQTAIMRKRR
ncbi:hypothetical protein L1887_21379 [Cichorium endivia]|nr:hypothetical protein L1887_21379 [Cichorium endivia]